MADKISVELIKQLRDRSGAGLMDCKAALAASDCDLDRASDWLREKGLAKAAKKARRIAAEGLALAIKCEKCGKVVILEVNCETDFVAKGDAFRALVEQVGRVILEKEPKDVEEAKALTESLFTDATVKMGEKFDLRRFVLIPAVEGQFITSYVHMGGKIASAVVLNADEPELGKGLAMHIAANNPQYLSQDEIAKDVLDHEKAVQLEAAKNDPKLAGKPAAMLEKIVEAKVNKYFAETILTSQPYLLDDSKTVGQALKEKGVSVIKFVRYQVGEGIEKRKDDFAAEVMNEVNK